MIDVIRLLMPETADGWAAVKARWARVPAELDLVTSPVMSLTRPKPPLTT